MVKNKTVKNLPPSPNTRSNKMRNMKQLAQQSLGTTTNNISAASNTQIYKGYCNSRRNETLTSFGYLSGDFSLTDLTGARFNYGRIDNANFTGSDLTNAKFYGNGCLNLAGANLTGTSIQGGSETFCTYFPLNSYITFTKDRTTTCITPLGENESILINRMLTTDNYNWQFSQINKSYFNSLDIYKVLELDATGFGLQSNNNNNRVSRFIFTNSLGKITITGSQLISSPTGINSNHIYLDSNNRLNITKPINDFVYGENPSGFKLKININQEATSQFRQGTASVILEYRTVGDTKSAPVSRCVINNSDSDCLNY